MARRRDYAAEYARRVAKGQAAGRTRQAARGHKPKEHVVRAERERRERGITSYEETRIRKWGEKRAAKNKDLRVQDLVDWSSAHGYRAFKALKRQQEAAHRQYKVDVKRSRYKSQGPILTRMYGGGGGYEGPSRGGGYEGPSRGGGYEGPGGYRDEQEAFEDFLDFEDFDWDYDVEDLDIGWFYYH
jgi:hypothetical protein